MDGLIRSRMALWRVDMEQDGRRDMSPLSSNAQYAFKDILEHSGGRRGDG